MPEERKREMLDYKESEKEREMLNDRGKEAR